MVYINYYGLWTTISPELSITPMIVFPKKIVDTCLKVSGLHETSIKIITVYTNIVNVKDAHPTLYSAPLIWKHLPDSHLMKFGPLCHLICIDLNQNCIKTTLGGIMWLMLLQDSISQIYRECGTVSRTEQKWYSKHGMHPPIGQTLHKNMCIITARSRNCLFLLQRSFYLLTMYRFISFTLLLYRMVYFFKSRGHFL